MKIETVIEIIMIKRGVSITCLSRIDRSDEITMNRRMNFCQSVIQRSGYISQGYIFLRRLVFNQLITPYLLFLDLLFLLRYFTQNIKYASPVSEHIPHLLFEPEVINILPPNGNKFSILEDDSVNPVSIGTAHGRAV